MIQANIKACDSKENGTFNVGTGLPRSFQDIAEILKKELNSNLEIEYFSNPYKGYQSHTQADISLTIKNMDYKPRFSLEILSLSIDIHPIFFKYNPNKGILISSFLRIKTDDLKIVCK